MATINKAHPHGNLESIMHTHGQPAHMQHQEATRTQMDMFISRQRFGPIVHHTFVMLSWRLTATLSLSLMTNTGLLLYAAASMTVSHRCGAGLHQSLTCSTTYPLSPSSATCKQHQTHIFALHPIVEICIHITVVADMSLRSRCWCCLHVPCMYDYSP